MNDNKKYYWLKLNENFFEDDTVAWLEEQENGKDYVIFYLKLCLKSLQDNGILIRYVGEKLIPYDVNALARLTDTKVDTVVVAMRLFNEIGLISKLDGGEIYMNQINEMIGSETDSAKRMRKLRARESVPSLCDNNVLKCDTEIEIDKELEIDKDKEKDIAPGGTSLLPKTSKYNILFETYNNQNIVNHRELTTKMKQAINAALKKDNQEDILKAIERYGQAYKDNSYQFCKYKMTLDKFLTQSNGYYDWLDEGQKWINYSDFKDKGATYAGADSQSSKKDTGITAEQAGVTSF